MREIVAGAQSLSLYQCTRGITLEDEKKWSEHRVPFGGTLLPKHFPRTNFLFLVRLRRLIRSTSDLLDLDSCQSWNNKIPSGRSLVPWVR